MACAKSVWWPALVSNVVDVSLSGANLGYWTACNNVKRYCMVPYTVMNIERPPCDVIDDIITIKKFCGIIWDALFISEVRLELCLTFQNFQTGHHFELDKLIFPEVIPEVEYTRNIAMSISDILSIWSMLQLKYWRRYINFKIWPFCDLVTSSMTSWIHIYIIVVIIS